MNRYTPPIPSPVDIRLRGIPKGYSGTRATMKFIQELVREGAKDFYVRQKAIDILLDQGVRAKDYLGEIRALFKWVQKNVRYTKDPFRVEALHGARRMLELRAGDCDDMTILLGAMLKSIGHPIRLILAGFDPRCPQLFSHIYLEANHRGRWIALDATMPYSMGWSPPAAFREIHEVEKEANMIGETDNELRGFDGSARMATGEVPGLWNFVVRMWRQGLQPRDQEIRRLWRLLRRQKRIGRRSWMRQFLSGTWQRGIQARDPQIRQFLQQLRAWGLVPPRGQPSPYGSSSGAPNWYLQPPAWYTQPPPWYRYRNFPGFPQQFAPRPPGFPGQIFQTAASLPGRALQTLTSAATAPFRAVTSLFR